MLLLLFFFGFDFVEAVKNHIKVDANARVYQTEYINENSLRYLHDDVFNTQKSTLMHYKHNRKS